MLIAVRRILGKAITIFPYFGKVFRIIQDASGNATYQWLGLLILQGAIPAGTVMLLKLLVDSLTQSVSSDFTKESIRIQILLGVLLILLQLLTELFRSLSVWLRTRISEQLEEHIMNLIHRQAIRLDLSFYESPDFYDRLYLARYEATWRPFALLENMGSMLQNIVTLLAMCAVLIRFGVWVPLALVASTLPALFTVFRYTLREHEWRMKRTPAQRMAAYYDDMLTDSHPASEIRIFGLGNYFQDAYRKIRETIRIEHLQLLKQRSRSELAAGLAGNLISGGMIVWIITKTARGLLTLGDLALFYQAFYQGQSMMRSLLNFAGQIYGNSLFLEKFFEYLSLEPKIREIDSPVRIHQEMKKGLVFRNVTFSYPGSNRPVLKDFNLMIPTRQVVAIVGPNGAGKTTLIKLLCRLYDPVSGTIEFDGKSLREFEIADLRRNITVLFQEPVHYSCTVKENIGIGNMESPLDDKKVEKAAQDAGAEQLILRLPQQYDTVLGKWLAGGTDLSLGEWQRLSLARAFYRKAPIILLDEPTSAMDSWAEADWMTRFRDLVSDRTGVIITHRFTTAMRADIIHVMEDGRIVESGTHEELLRAQENYAASWNLQMNQVQNTVD